MPTNEPVVIDRRVFEIKIGKIVAAHGRNYRIENLISFSEVLCTDLETKRPKLIDINELKPIDGDEHSSKQLSLDDSEIGDNYWQIALNRFALIKPLIETSTLEAVEAVALSSGNHYTTVYNWLKLYRDNRSILALVPQKRGWRENKSRLDIQTEMILRTVLNDFYLTAQKPLVSKVIQLINTKCSSSGIVPPHPNTVRNRIKTISPYKRLHAHGEKAKAKDLYSPASKSFPGAEYPLAYVQIDHTPLDIIIVDDEQRLPIGRPYLTLAIDVFSRVIVGYYLSLDAPSTTSVAMCITCAILPKNKLLLDLDINCNWDIWGFMSTIHTDNGSDFRVDSLSRACLKYNINWEYRPIGGARFGGHIERLLGTVNRELHTIPGATFSNVAQRGSYDSDGKAVMSFNELERYVVTWITKVYHNTKHTALGLSPLQKWEEGIWGTDKTPGTGLGAKVADSDTLIIDFLPEFSRTVQRYGIEIEGLLYYADVLRRWIGAEDPSDPKKKRKFTCKRDPRDISSIRFYDPETKMYFHIPTAKQEIPPISIWEYNQVQKHISDSGKNASDQNVIYDAIRELREQVSNSENKTRKQRRAAQRQKLHQKSSVKTTSPAATVTENVSIDKRSSSIWDEPVTGYSDIK